jgi:hypothetical protein
LYLYLVEDIIRGRDGECNERWKDLKRRVVRGREGGAA